MRSEHFDKAVEYYRIGCGRVDQFSFRDRLLLFLVLCGLFISIWYFFLFTSLQQSNSQLKDRVKDLKQQVTVIQAKSEMSRGKTIDVFQGARSRHKALYAKLDALDRQIQSYNDRLVFPGDLFQLLQEMAQQEKGISLQSMDNKPDYALVHFSKNDAGKEQGIYVREVMVRFDGDYFTTIAFLKHLEKIKHKLFWGGFTYKVSAYPYAKISLSLHTLSREHEEKDG